MAILITDGLARPELNTAAGPSIVPPPMVRMKPRRQRPAFMERIDAGAFRGMWDEADPQDSYLPSPETIATECAAIRTTWSERERLARAGMLDAFGRRPHWTPPGTINGLRGEA